MKDVFCIPAYRLSVLGIAAFLSMGATAMAKEDPFQQCGKASWYKLGGKTASGERANPQGMTAAHRTLPFGTLVDVTNLSNGKTVTVRINDRGPFSKGRVIDVTLAAARELGFVNKGITRVRVSSADAGGGNKHSQKCQ
ncbi:septal ring lytic transglycosylase RlpA family protein [Roseibium sp. MMSF_3544]|uniref:septal ring lytic transglycosylase RlpA family protein n=1 Tax=unclassified Roseibium TaxID=2629323 RepID=UPI00273E6BF2|nr:septal ring lytic transglycosylase RlpA family protein [Roseibium sp. MMSF_3544]